MNLERLNSRIQIDDVVDVILRTPSGIFLLLQTKKKKKNDSVNLENDG